ncbi:MAG: alanine--glyoxylate aminotransferase family protein [Chloroflexi bacterium]|nr:alanine--glyoxylate aminotransferase family protein [Chloroflexota bacterium]MCL5109108.1 alanine--glyoxylate aminotransferase family protein [Chloroflexota bacterium]
MRTYRVPMVPGPTAVPPAVLAAYQADYGSADLEDEYFDLYAQTEGQLQLILQTRNQCAIMTGEGMLALWGAVKSCLKAGDRVLAVSTGLFGSGIGDLARSIGAQVESVDFPWNAVADPDQVEAAIKRVRPKMVTMVHCETSSGTLNPVGAVGALVAKHDVPLFYVDGVSSAAGTELLIDGWHIDLGLIGTQKCLSSPPDLAIVTVSERAWRAVDEVGYQGYDALAPWKTALSDRYFPYTPYWQGLAALSQACQLILAEGLAAVFARHAQAAQACRQGLAELGLELYSGQETYSSPTVTAVQVPGQLGWAELDKRLRRRGVAVGGNYGQLAGKVFRLGHMGSQARVDLVQEALEALREALAGE